MRVAQLSDLHFGDAKTLPEVEGCASAAIDAVLARGADIAVISGDSTDHAIDAHSPSFVALARQVRRLTDHCPVLMLQGTFSHEPPGTLDIFRLLGGRYPVYVADRIGQVAWRRNDGWAASAGWAFDAIPDNAEILFTCVPTVNKAFVAAVVGAEQAAQALGDRLAALLAGFGRINALARVAGIPTAGVSHGTVSGCVTEHGVPMASLDHEFTTGALFAAGASAFLLGHIHKHQSWEQDGRIIAYPGSIGRLHYGEEDAKGCLLWDIAAQRASFEFIATPARRMAHFSFAGSPDMDVLRQQALATAGAFVRVRWEIPEEEQASVDRAAIESLFAAAAELKLEGRVIPVLRARAAGISRRTTLLEKLDRWAALTGVENGSLNERLALLQTGSAEAIAQTILAQLGAAEGAPVDEVAPTSSIEANKARYAVAADRTANRFEI
jgi:DNA repair protein SbcD/Mre11